MSDLSDHPTHGQGEWVGQNWCDVCDREVDGDE